jgi:pentose-5-phosphate-3-epimerase
MVKIAPSILSADQANLKWALDAAHDGGADYIHLDVMDLHFVPNLTIGPSVCADLAVHTKLPLDIHLMIDNPELFITLLIGQLNKRMLGREVRFEDIAEFPAGKIKQIYKSTDSKDLALALKGAKKGVFEKVLESISKDDSAKLVQQMGNFGTVKRDDILEAQKSIAVSIKKDRDINPVKYIVVHQEASHHLDRMLNYIRSMGFNPGVSINPATPVSTIEHIIHLCDLVLIMSVNPGFGGQEFIPYSLDKVRQVKKFIEERHLPTVIEIDGGIKPDNAGYAVRAGCDILVAGAAVFNDKATPAENIKAIRDACAQVA